MKEMWDKRYASNEYVYGEQPNDFLKVSIDNQNLKGRILFPAEGEGRNAVYAAKKGMDVVAFDISEQGCKKALDLAKRNHVKIRYFVGDFLQMPFEEASFDVVALIYAHFPLSIRKRYYDRIVKLLKPGGLILLEGFSIDHLKLKKKKLSVGGPSDPKMLFSSHLIKEEFPSLEIVELNESVIGLDEGALHQGESKVVRFIGRRQR